MSLSLVLAVTVPRLEGDRGGHHLEHGARLVDVGHDRVDEARRVGRGDRAVLVGVVRRVAGLGVDLPGVGVHDHGRHALGLVRDVRGQELLLDGQLQARVDGQAQVLAGDALLGDLGRLGPDPPAHVALRHGHARLAGQDVLVVALDAVLARALAVDEPEEVRGQARVGAAAGLRVDPLGLGLQADADDPAVARGLADALAEPGLDAAGEDDVGLGAGQLLAQDQLGGGLQLEQADERVAGRLDPVRGDLVGRGDEPLAVDGRGQEDDAGPVEDVAAAAGRSRW